MKHLLHLIVFASLLSVFFAFLVAPEGRRWRYGSILWLSLVGAAVVLALIMYPVS